HRIASADARQPMEDVAKSLGDGRFFERRAGVGDSDEALWRLARADGLSCPLEEILLEDVGLQRAARFARYQEQCPREVDPGFQLPDLCGVGRVEDVQLWKFGLAAKGFAEDLGTEARSAHAEQRHIRKPRPPDILGKFLQ